MLGFTKTNLFGPRDSIKHCGYIYNVNKIWKYGIKTLINLISDNHLQIMIMPTNG